MEEDQKSINYNRIAKAIAYIIAHHDQQPSLEEIADHVHLSSFHFQYGYSVFADINTWYIRRTIQHIWFSLNCIE